jgi:hypothetical protein
MKKILSAFTLIVFLVPISFSQDAVKLTDVAGEEPGRDVTDIVCPEGSLYSQTPVDVNAATGLNDNVLYDNILSSPAGTVNEITFWMTNLGDPDPVNLDIIFRHDDGGAPGSIFASYSVSLTGVPTGELLLGSYEIYTYTYEFATPLIIVAGDWVGIKPYPVEYGHHYWVFSSDGDLLDYLYPGFGPYFFTDFAFCLRGSSEIPISNWALGIGILLILAATLFRLRRS